LAALYTIGLHFGIKSLHVHVVDIRDGRVAGRASLDHAAQHAQSTLDMSSRACRDAFRAAGVSPDQIIGIGIACAEDVALLRSADGTRLQLTSEQFGLPAGIAVSAVALDTQAAVPGAGVASPSTLVMSIARGLHLLNSRVKATVPGIVGPVEDGILPGYLAYEIHQLHQPKRARAVEPAREAIESAAMDLRRRCDALRDAGVPVRRFVALDEPAAAEHSRLQIFADVLDSKIKLAASTEPAALGAAILGGIAAGAGATGYHSISQVIHAMAAQREEPVYRPDLRARKHYDRLYENYRATISGEASGPPDQ
jgi:ribulose kinase